jgi:hypothetical protein
MVAARHRRLTVLLATHGWWPSLLLYADIIIGVVCMLACFLKRRRAA